MTPDSRVPARARRRLAMLLIALGLAVASCTDSGSGATGSSQPSGTDPMTPTSLRPSTTIDPTTIGRSPAAQLPAIQTLVAAALPIRRYSLGTDRLEVWICRVPKGVKDPIYNPVDFRLDIDADRATVLLNKHVSAFFRTLSHGLYAPEFLAGGEVPIDVDESDERCVEKAVNKSADEATGVVVIADAEHRSDQPGGWGRPGRPCDAAATLCSARVTGRATYIGASDFHPEWGEVPAIDLQEHEIGHSLGLPHSGEGGGYTSAIDLMSNSAAPREVDPARRNGPDTLGINRVALGWLPLEDVEVGDPAGSRHRLVPSSAPDGRRLLLLPLDDLRLLTLEVRTNSGFDDHLPAPGVVVHEIDQRPAACRGETGTEPCVNEYRRQPVRSGTAPYTDLLGAGETWSGSGWTVRVTGSDGTSFTVEVRRDDNTKEQP